MRIPPVYHYTQEQIRDLLNKNELFKENRRYMLLQNQLGSGGGSHLNQRMRGQLKEREGLETSLKLTDEAIRYHPYPSPTLPYKAQAGRSAAP